MLLFVLVVGHKDEAQSSWIILDYACIYHDPLILQTMAFMSNILDCPLLCKQTELFI